MAYTKTTWTDRNVQYPNRYTKTDVDTDTVDLVAEPGTVTEEGTPVNATNMNKIETGVYDAHVAIEAGLLENSVELAKGMFTVQAQIAAGKNDLSQLAIDAFNDETGIASKTNQIYNSSTKLYYPTGGTISKANLPATVTASNTTAGAPADTYDGSTGQSWFGAVGGWLKFDLGSAYAPNSIYFHRFSMSNYTIKIEYSDDDSTYTVGVASASLPKYSSENTIDTSSCGSHRYWRITCTAGDPGYDFGVNEVTFNVYCARDTMTIISNALTCATAPTKVFCCIDKTVYGSDTFTSYASRDDGSTWTEIIEDSLTDISSQPSGTSLKLKVIVAGGYYTNYSTLNAWAWGYK